MKKYSLMMAAAAAVGLCLLTGPASAQQQPGSASASSPHQIGLIDMAHIFKNYEKFKDANESLQKAAEDAEAKAQEMIRGGQELTAKLQTFQPGTPDYNKVESQLIELSTKLESFKKIEQREIHRKQADVYKQIYLEVQDLVNQYARHWGYTLVIRFNRGDVAEAGNNPQQILQNMNRQVVYYQKQDDITDPILEFLNDRYRQQARR